jgi:signal peptide peptidase SppA
LARNGAVAVLPIRGVLTQHPSLLSMLFGTSYDEIGTAFRTLVADPSVGQIVLDMDSPGGMVSGCPELAAEILAARSVKPVLAIANGMMASAAYWIAAGAQEIIALPSAEIGSIGAMMAHVDFSKALAMQGEIVTILKSAPYKDEGTPVRPLTDDDREAIQRRVDQAGDMFVRAVAKARRKSPAAVAAGFGQGRVLSASDALAAGVVDRIAMIPEVLGVAAPGRAASRGMAGAASPETWRALFEFAAMEH